MNRLIFSSVSNLKIYWFLVQIYVYHNMSWFVTSIGNNDLLSESRSLMCLG